ncbi:MAG TPA: adenylate/guanylate cyclase domain-containing protein, partial [Thiotrichaceae bacterium]|nr:adenylate/guanylate cyclase domain-containing protein [Thiotrichaceae bacterium]
MNKATSKHKRFKFTFALTRLLLQVSNELARSKTVDDALERLVEISTHQIGAERGTIFINDPKTNELYSRVAQGQTRREIRIMNNSGVAGWAFTNDESLIINEAYEDKRFNKVVDTLTGYITDTLLTTPFRTADGKCIGVAQLINKKDKTFTESDLELFEAIIQQASVAMQSKIILEEREKEREKEMDFLAVVTHLSSELDLNQLLDKIIPTITRMLNSDRSTLFINDKKTNELFTMIGQGLGKVELRFPNHLGIAGTVFTTGDTINIPHAYADLRFNPSVDKQTGYFTRSMLCVPVKNKKGNVIGVTQVLNKKGGVFTDEDEGRLAAFTSQIAIGIENAKLFGDVEKIRRYNESILHSMSNGLITLSPEFVIVTANYAAQKMFDLSENALVEEDFKSIFEKSDQLLLEVLENADGSELVDIKISANNIVLSSNITIQLLLDETGKDIGKTVLIEDITGEKRMRSTLSRYMDPALANQVLSEKEGLLGGTSSMATILFSDIRSFTTITEKIGAEGTVSFLNEYFTLMVDEIQNEGGMLDKFIGDAIMAVFGIPLMHDDDSDRAVRAGINMMAKLDIFNESQKANTDTVISGNIGSPKRMDYTVIGDGVNLASRIESACKQYGAHILISGNTYAQLKGTYRTRLIDHVIVKGKTHPVALYELLDYVTNISAARIDNIGFFNDGMRFYMDGDFVGATKQFKLALAAHKEDVCSRLYVDRC